MNNNVNKKKNFFADVIFLLKLKKAIINGELKQKYLTSLLDKNYNNTLNCFEKYQEIIIKALSEKERMEFIVKISGKIKGLSPLMLKLCQDKIDILINNLLFKNGVAGLIEILRENNFAIFSQVSLFSVVNSCKHLMSQDDVRELCLKLIENNKPLYLMGFINNKLKMGESAYPLTLLVKLFDMVIEHENLTWLDIDLLTPKPNYVNVVQIGSKIIKVGKRFCGERPKDIRFLKNIIEINLNELASQFSGWIELTEKVELATNFSDNELYEMYEEIRARGIICSDFKWENIGVLLKDNVQHWEQPIPKGLQGFVVKDAAKEYLKTGDWVLIDLDYIYHQDDPEIRWYSGTELLEKRYQQKHKLIKRLKKH